MPKKVKDITETKKYERLSLRQKTGGIPLKENDRLRKGFGLFKKTQSQTKDISSKETLGFYYVKGEKFTPPKTLGNLLKIGGLGLLIIVAINLVSVYFSGLALQKEIESSATMGYESLVNAGKDTTKIEFAKAVEAFDKALENFSAAKDKLWFINSDISFYSKDIEAAQSVNNLLEGGKNFAVAGNLFLESMEDFNKIPVYFFSKNSGEQQEGVDLKESITEILKKGLQKTDQAIAQINLAAENFNKVNESFFPDNIALRIEMAKKQINETQEILNSISKHFPAILKLLGDQEPHRYLILLQNNNEIRPTGGFIGSYIILDMNDGYIDKLETHDVYDIDGSYTEMITPPDELAGFTDNWRFRDSNYHPDFPTSASTAAWMLEKEGGPTVDTVIAINQGLLKGLLEVTGPVQVGNFGTLDADNYNLLLSYIIEGKIWGEEDPKHILKIFIPAFKEEIFKTQNIGKLSSKIIRAVQQKHIMMYSSDKDIEALFDAAGLSGRMHPNVLGEDYLSVINTSVGGTKSDQFVEENITHETYISDKGEIIDEVKIARKHVWTDDIYYSWKRILQKYGFNEMPDQLIDILGRGRNKVSIRVYVPKNCELIDSSKKTAVKFDKETDRTYFITEMEINAGQQDELTLKYRLPFNMDFNPTAQYKLIVEKQSGSVGSIFTKTLTLAGSIKELGVYPEESKIGDENSLTYATNLVYDRYFSALLSK